MHDSCGVLTGGNVFLPVCLPHCMPLAVVGRLCIPVPHQLVSFLDKIGATASRLTALAGVQTSEAGP